MVGWKLRGFLGLDALEARFEAFPPLVVTMVADLEGGRFKVVLGNGEFERVIDRSISDKELEGVERN